MCRRNQLLGLGILAFGLGLLVGCWLESELLRNCLGLGLLAAGVLCWQKN